MFVKLQEKTNGKFPERKDGNMSRIEQTYWECKSVILGEKNGGITPFRIGSTGKDKIDFDRRRASAFVKGVDRDGISFIKRNYPLLCEQPAL